MITRKDTTKSPKEEERKDLQAVLHSDKMVRAACNKDMEAIRLKKNQKTKTLYIENKVSLKISLAVCFEHSSYFLLFLTTIIFFS